LSVAVTANVTLLAQVPPEVLTLTLAGQVITGSSAWLTVTVKLHVALLPWPSLALQFTVVGPRAKLLPLAGVQVTAAVPQLSVAVTAKVTLLVQVPPEVLTLMLAGQVITGASVSLTVTVKLHVAELPWPSLALQFTVLGPRAKLLPLAGVQVTVAVPQLSVAVTAKVTLLAQVPAEVLTLMLAGQVMTGSSLSLTVTVKLHVALFPWPSLALQVTVVGPRAKLLPLAGVQVTVAAPQLSVAVAVKVTLLAQVPPEVLTLMLAGQVTTGASASLTVTVKLHVALLPWPSSALQFTVVGPRAKLLPLAGVQVTVAVPQLSVAVTAKVTLLEQVPPDVLTLMLAGQVMTGTSLSLTVTVKLQVALLPWPSLALQFTVVGPRAKLLPLAVLHVTVVVPQLSVAVTSN